MNDFNEIIERRGTGCVKYDKVDKGMIPLWVADMDFRTPDFIIEAIEKRLGCPVLGYPFIPKDYFPTISRWVRKLHGWEVNPAHIRYVPGIVKGIALAQCALLPRGSKVIIQPPVYHPFRIVSQKLGNEVVFNPLLLRSDGSYEMEFESLEQCMAGGGRMLILSNPQNPSGQCWTAETLRHVASLAKRYGVIVVSDEIHGEMAHRGFTHTPFASVSPEAAQCSITFMAPSKTFNIAGVVTSYAIVPSDELRERFFSFLEATELDYPTIFAIEATLAAYRKGAVWRRQMLRYVEGNIDFVCSFLEKNIPAIRPLRPQASFLIWLDCRGLGLSQRNLMHLLKVDAGLFLNDGTMFGPEGNGFVRMNVGCPRSILAEALTRLQNAVQQKAVG